MKTRNMLSARVLQFIIVMFIAGPVFSGMVAAQTYTDDQHVEPAFEGWRPNPDGSFNMMFGLSLIHI